MTPTLTLSPSPSHCSHLNTPLPYPQAAHLLKYDSVLGTFDADVQYGDDWLSIDGKQIKLIASRDPTKCGWGDMGVEVIIEGTGAFNSLDGSSKHLEAGAKKVLHANRGNRGRVGAYLRHSAYGTVRSGCLVQRSLGAQAVHGRRGIPHREIITLGIFCKKPKKSEGTFAFPPPSSSIRGSGCTHYVPYPNPFVGREVGFVMVASVRARP